MIDAGTGADLAVATFRKRSGGAQGWTASGIYLLGGGPSGTTRYAFTVTTDSGRVTLHRKTYPPVDGDLFYGLELPTPVASA